MLKLKRIRAGLYRTLDGRFEIQKDPTSGGEYGGWGFTSWLVFEKGDDEPCWPGQVMQHESLYAARTRLERELTKRASWPQ